MHLNPTEKHPSLSLRLYNIIVLEYSMGIQRMYIGRSEKLSIISKCLLFN